MRKKSLKLILTFDTMTAAMAADAALGSALGRLIPVPSEIHAGCGFAWSADPSLEGAIETVMEREQLSYEGKFFIELY